MKSKRRRSGSRSRKRRRRSRSSSERSIATESVSEDAYGLDLLPCRRAPPLPTFDIEVEEDGESKLIRHVHATPGKGYVIKVSNNSPSHVACSVTVDGENALLRDGSLIVAPRESRELPGFLVSKNFVGKEYVKEYRDFIFGKPKVVVTHNGGKNSEVQEEYVRYGLVCCSVYEAVLDEEVDSDQELRGQTTFYRGAGLHGSFDERIVPEGKKTHLMYSSVTVQGSRSSIANSTRGRWWVRGPRLLKMLEVRYREAHSLMLLGIKPAQLGLPDLSRDSAGSSFDGKVKLEKAKGKSDVKKDDDDDWDKKEDDEQDDPMPNSALTCAPGFVHVCDLTEDIADGGDGEWTLAAVPPRAAPVDIDEGGGGGGV